MTLLAALDLSELIDYLVPLAALILYFIVSNKKKPEGRKEAPPAKMEPPTFPKVIRPKETPLKRVPFETAIENRTIDSPITHRQVTEGEPLVDYADETRKKKYPSKGRKLLRSKSSLRSAVLLNTLLQRPYE
jgi:hypothetical protein